MARKTTIKSKIAYRIKRSASSVFVRKDFDNISDYDQVGRILRELVQTGMLINIGYGVYARTKTSSLTGNIIPEKSLPELAQEALRKLKVKTVPSNGENSYNRGQSTQVPTGRVIGVRGRISRKISYNGSHISFEQHN
ncbi:MAG: hypothetical protein EOM67_12215 [Spirochaetia bacterium]|nr:hypothetical protein [Spirochaetia bacterium]